MQVEKLTYAFTIISRFWECSCPCTQSNQVNI